MLLPCISSVRIFRAVRYGYNKFALKRLVDKEQIISIHKGYTSSYRPNTGQKEFFPYLVLDAFMKELDRLLPGIVKRSRLSWSIAKAATGVFVVTGFPVMRPMQKKV